MLAVNRSETSDIGQSLDMVTGMIISDIVFVKTATEVGVRAIQDHKVIE